ncbi:hypothetical protein [Mesoterricola silvestris]|uniref:hypothetical protein n=1 Tax=Mesoterricola silvestris TaxID=2927979 RepID=UPI002931A304|nr:hypothetical protein [Mesoterricola silvestris]
MKPSLLLSIPFLSALLGCGIIGNYQRINLYPVNSTGMNQPLNGTIYNLSGKIKLTLANGTEYQGELFKVARPQDPSDTLYSDKLGFPKNWDAVYGDHYYSKNVLGSERYWRCNLTTTSTDSIYLEIIRPNLNSDIRLGVAVDSKGQAYKVTF